MNEKLFTKMFKSIIVYMADNARAEQLAGEKLMYQEEAQGSGGIFDAILPALRKIGQDKPHGVRRPDYWLIVDRWCINVWPPRPY